MMNSGNSGLVPLAVALVALLFAPEVCAEDTDEPFDFILIDSSLRAESIEIQNLTRERIEYTFDGLDRFRPHGEVLALVRRNSISLHEPSAMVELVDGRRWVGPWLIGPADTGGERVVIRHDYFGRLETPLENVLRARPRYGGDLPSLHDLRSAEGDQVRFTNGDIQEGFVLALGNPTIIEDERGQRTTVELTNVESIGLLNPAEPAKGRRLWLTDGSVFEIRSITIRGETAEVRKAESGEPVWIGLDSIEAIVFNASGFMPLAHVPVGARRSEGWMSTIDPPRIMDLQAPGGLSDIELTGPGEVDFTLPENVTRFAAEAGIPRRALGWADFHLTILADGAPLAEWALNKRQSRVPIVLDIPPGAVTLTVRIAEGRRGPVQNALLLEMPRLHRAP